MASHHYLIKQNLNKIKKKSNIIDLIKKSKIRKDLEVKYNFFLISATLVLFLVITKIIIF